MVRLRFMNSDGEDYNLDSDDNCDEDYNYSNDDDDDDEYFD